MQLSDILLINISPVHTIHPYLLSHSQLVRVMASSHAHKSFFFSKLYKFQKVFIILSINESRFFFVSSYVYILNKSERKLYQENLYYYDS